MRTFITVSITLFVTALFLIGAALIWEIRRSNSSDFIDETLYSEILGEEVTLHTRVPWSYEDATDAYPLVIKLDGDARLGWHDSTLQTLSELGIGDAIVVGVSNGRGQRNRNLTPTGWPQELEAPEPVGEGDRFLDFIEQELIPDIEARYRVNHRRILVGYSRGGLLTVYAYIDGRTSFDSYVALSPSLWRDDSQIAALYLEAQETGALPDACLFLSLGNEENPRMRGGYEAFLAALNGQQNESLNWRSHIAEGGDHQTTPVLALPHFYSFVFGPEQGCG